MKAGKTRVWRSRKGVSVVIATVILVAVAIVVSVAVAFWMGSITGQYTRFEKLQVVDPLSAKGASYWNLTFTIRNTGAADATIDNVLINGYTANSTKWNAIWSQSDDGTTWENFNCDLLIPSGQTKYMRIDIPLSATSSGTTLEIKFHSAAGMEYPKMVMLP